MLSSCFLARDIVLENCESLKGRRQSLGGVLNRGVVVSWCLHDQSEVGALESTWQGPHVSDVPAGVILVKVMGGLVIANLVTEGIWHHSLAQRASNIVSSVIDRGRSFY